MDLDMISKQEQHALSEQVADGHSGIELRIASLLELTDHFLKRHGLHALLDLQCRCVKHWMNDHGVCCQKVDHARKALRQAADTAAILDRL